MSNDTQSTGHASGTWVVPSEQITTYETDLYQHDYTFTIPKHTWKVVIGTNEKRGLTIHYTDEQVPCWFHRKMQEFVLGFRWNKL